MASEQSWWNSPMPTGWEAKYDTGQKRYFFVNHSTRATTWEDPRKAVYQQRQQQQQPSWQQASPYRHSPAAQHESIPMAQMTSHGQSRWQTELEEKYNMKVRILPSEDDEEDDEETSFTQANLQRLKQAFPTAPEDVIRDLLISVQDNESRARQELKALGFKQSVTASASSLGSQSSSSRASSSQRATSPNRAPSPRRSASPQPKSPQKAASPKMTEDQKNRMKEQYRAEYPNCTASVIAMALEAANYDGTKAKMLLQTMSGSTAAKKAQRSRDSSPKKGSEERTFSSATPSLDSTGQVSASGVAVSFPDTSTPSTSASMYIGSSSFASHTQSTASASTSDYLKADTGVKTTDNASISDYMKKSFGPAASPTKQQQRQTRARTPVGQAARAKSTTYKSAYRTEAKGPNSSLAQGPNVDLLIDDYVSQQGPNRSIQNGPAYSNRSGPCHYTGRDRSLAQGPNYSICNGPNPDLVQGSMYGSALTRRHVTPTAV